MSPAEDRTRDTVDSEPKHYQLSYSGPLAEFKSQIILALFYGPKWLTDEGGEETGVPRENP